MSERTRTILFTVLWGALVIIALVTLFMGYSTGNVVLLAIAALATFAVVKTHVYIPLPKYYADQGMTNDVFVSKRRRRLNEQKRNGSAE